MIEKIFGMGRQAGNKNSKLNNSCFMMVILENFHLNKFKTRKKY